MVISFLIINLLIINSIILIIFISYHGFK